MMGKMGKNKIYLVDFNLAKLSQYPRLKDLQGKGLRFMQAQDIIDYFLNFRVK